MEMVTYLALFLLSKMAIVWGEKEAVTMNGFRLSLTCCVVFFACRASGNVDIRTEITDICYRGTYERVGAVTFSLNGDDYFDASPDTPIFCRIRMAKEAVNATTLVDIESSERGHEPIYLAVSLQGNYGVASLTAPADAVSIVRWRAGESEIWLKIASSTGEWIDRDGVLGPPDVSVRVEYSLGIDPRRSEANNRWAYNQGDANRPSNAYANGLAADTTWRIDVSDSVLPSFPDLNSVVDVDHMDYDAQTLGVTTVEDPSRIVLGNPTLASFNPEIVIARGFDYNRVFPWVSDNAKFQSWIVINNLLASETTARLVAQRGDGVSLNAQRDIPPFGFLRQPVSALFPELSGQGGYSVTLESCDRHLGASWTTLSARTEIGQSISAGMLQPPPDQDWHSSNSNGLLFSYLPHNRGYLSSVAITNVGDRPCELSVFAFNRGGERVSHQVFFDQVPHRTFACMTHEFEGIVNDVQLVVISDQPIVGISYIFDPFGSIATSWAQPVDPDVLSHVEPHIFR